MSGFFVSHWFFGLACAAINRVNLAFTTTIIEDTHLTLAAILFQVEANNSFIFLLLQTYEKKFAEFPFLLVYNSLVIEDAFLVLSPLEVDNSTSATNLSPDVHLLDAVMSLYYDVMSLYIQCYRLTDHRGSLMTATFRLMMTSFALKKERD